MISHLSRILFYACLPMALSGGCSPDSHPSETVLPAESLQGNRPPSIRSARVVPAPLTLDGPVSVEIDAEDADGDALSYEYRWWVNDELVRDAASQTISADLLKKGDTVMAEVVAFDRKQRSPAFTTVPVLIQDNASSINRVSLEFESRPAAASRLKAKVDGMKQENDDLGYTYRWWRNDIIVKEGQEDFLETAGLARKDSILVEVVSQAPGLKGISYKSPPAVIGNAPPKIHSKPSSPDRPGHYQYRVEADDPDGDSLVYGLEIAPPGMVIDAASGHITWTVSSELAGTHRVKVSVDDGQGGLAWQEFEISIPPASSVHPART